MKATKITYWTATLLVAVMMAFSAYSYFTSPMAKEGFIHLGFPDYFRIELGIAKLIGAILLIVPLYATLKEWVYAGFTITFISAFIGHSVSGDPMQYTIMPVVSLLLLGLSYFTYHKMHAAKSLVVAKSFF